jgi:hypothetical protein
MPQIIDTSHLTIFSSVSGGLVLAYALGIFLTRSSFQYGEIRPMRTNAHAGHHSGHNKSKNVSMQ